MTDRYNALLVVLDRDIRDDDAEPLIAAIRQLRGVASVSGNVADPGSHIAHMQAKSELAAALWNVLYPKGESNG